MVLEPKMVFRSLNPVSQHRWFAQELIGLSIGRLSSSSGCLLNGLTRRNVRYDVEFVLPGKYYRELPAALGSWVADLAELPSGIPRCQLDRGSEMAKIITTYTGMWRQRCRKKLEDVNLNQLSSRAPPRTHMPYKTRCSLLTSSPNSGCGKGLLPRDEALLLHWFAV